MKSTEILNLILVLCLFSRPPKAIKIKQCDTRTSSDGITFNFTVIINFMPSLMAEKV